MSAAPAAWVGSMIRCLLSTIAAGFAALAACALLMCRLCRRFRAANAESPTIMLAERWPTAMCAEREALEVIRRDVDDG